MDAKELVYQIEQFPGLDVPIKVQVGQRAGEPIDVSSVTLSNDGEILIVVDE